MTTQLANPCSLMGLARWPIAPPKRSKTQATPVWRSRTRILVKARSGIRTLPTSLCAVQRKHIQHSIANLNQGMSLMGFIQLLRKIHSIKMMQHPSICSHLRCTRSRAKPLRTSWPTVIESRQLIASWKRPSWTWKSASLGLWCKCCISSSAITQLSSHTPRWRHFCFCTHEHDS